SHTPSSSGKGTFCCASYWMIWVTLEVSTGGSLTNLEKTWKPGAQTLMFLEPNGLSAKSSWMAFKTTRSRAASWEPSKPRDFSPNCFKRSVPDSFGSNSAILRLPAPKSTHKNDFEFSICTSPAALPQEHVPFQLCSKSNTNLKVFAGY